MKDADYKAQKKRVEAVIKKWEAPLGMRWWHITHNWHDEPYGGVEDNVQPVARTTVQWEYGRANIHWYLSEIAQCDDDHIEKMVVHEFCHVLVNEMRQWQDASDALMHEERVVSNLTSALMWVREAGRKK